MKTNWKIADLKRKTDSGLVFEVVYIINFELDDESDRHVGIEKFEGNPSDPSFVPFENLTEEIVLQWIKEKLGQEEINKISSEIETRLQDRIFKKNNPEFLNGLPWN